MIDRDALGLGCLAAVGVVVFILLCILWDGFGAVMILLVAGLAVAGFTIHAVYYAITGTRLDWMVQEWVQAKLEAGRNE